MVSGNLPSHLEKIRITTKRYNCHIRRLCLELQDCFEEFWRPKAASRSLPSEYLSSKKTKLSNMNNNNNNNNNNSGAPWVIKFGKLSIRGNFIITSLYVRPDVSADFPGRGK